METAKLTMWTQLHHLCWPIPHKIRLKLHLPNRCMEHWFAAGKTLLVDDWIHARWMGEYKPSHFNGKSKNEGKHVICPDISVIQTLDQQAIGVKYRCTVFANHKLHIPLNTIQCFSQQFIQFIKIPLIDYRSRSSLESSNYFTVIKIRLAVIKYNVFIDIFFTLSILK